MNRVALPCIHTRDSLHPSLAPHCWTTELPHLCSPGRQVASSAPSKPGGDPRSHPPRVHQTQPPTLPWPHLLLCSSRLPWSLRAFAPAVCSQVSAGMSPPHRGLPWPPCLRAPAQPHAHSGPPWLIDLHWPVPAREGEGPDRCAPSRSQAEPILGACLPLGQCLQPAHSGQGLFLAGAVCLAAGIFAKGQSGGVPWLSTRNSSRMCNRLAESMRLWRAFSLYTMWPFLLPVHPLAKPTASVPGSPPPRW